MIDAYVKTLASVVGSEEEAKKKIYSVCTTRYTGFGALISEELSYKVKGLPRVLWVLPDSYLDVPNKDYGGDLFVDGKVIHRPQYTGRFSHLVPEFEDAVKDLLEDNLFCYYGEEPPITAAATINVFPSIGFWWR
ncbi:hypothetical protein V6N13_069931 [Hibiscus sabdariffa]